MQNLKNVFDKITKCRCIYIRGLAKRQDYITGGGGSRYCEPNPRIHNLHKVPYSLLLPRENMLVSLAILPKPITKDYWTLSMFAAWWANRLDPKGYWTLSYLVYLMSAQLTRAEFDARQRSVMELYSLCRNEFKRPSYAQDQASSHPVPNHKGWMEIYIRHRRMLCYLDQPQ